MMGPVRLMVVLSLHFMDHRRQDRCRAVVISDVTAIVPLSYKYVNQARGRNGVLFKQC